MKIFITIIIVVVALVALLFIIGLFTRKDYSVQREIIINKPTSEIFNYLKFLKNHDKFNKWLKTDPNMKKSFTGLDGTVGFVYAYNGNKDVGSGELQITGLKENESINIQLHFISPFESVNNSPYALQAVSENQTKVKWTMEGRFNYPKNIALLFLNLDKFLGKDVQLSLENLKAELETPSKN